MIAPGVQVPIGRFRFRIRMQEALRLPSYAGSLLRGQFGAALRRAACLTGATQCVGCPLRATCPYPLVFDAPPPSEHALQKFSQVPNSYVIEPPPYGTAGVAAGDALDFGMVLVGRALGQLPLIAHAWERAFAHGLGRERACGLIEEIAREVPPTGVGGPTPDAESVWDADERRIRPHESRLTVPDLQGLPAMTLSIRTPLRLQNQGRPLGPGEVTPRVLIGQLVRRVSLLLELHADMPPSGKEAAIVRESDSLRQWKDLRWLDWARYSSRQQQEMHLGGVVGTWTLAGEALETLAPWLWLGQWTHAGKNATFGLGAYSLAQPRQRDVDRATPAGVAAAS